MNRELLDKWVAALRSGKYKQGIKQLRNQYEEFCCLGVLCEVMELERFDDGYIAEGNYYEGMLRKVGSVERSPDLRETLGLDVEVKDYLGQMVPFDYYLMHLNDTQRASFGKIAEVIEKFKDKIT